MKYLHHIIDNFVLNFIGRALIVLSERDKRIEAELKYLPADFSAAVAVEKNGPYIVIKKVKNKMKYYGFRKKLNNVDLKIYFKDEEFAYQVLAAKEGIRQAFAEHKAVLEGDLEYALSFIYILEITEAYLMSDQFAENILAYDFKRVISRLQLIIRALFLFKEKGEL